MKVMFFRLLHYFVPIEKMHFFFWNSKFVFVVNMTAYSNRIFMFDHFNRKSTVFNTEMDLKGSLIYWYLLLLPIVWCNNNTVVNQAILRRKRDESISSAWARILHGYATLVRPNYLGDPTVVSVDITVLSFGQINERDMTFASDLFLRQTWYDGRLKHNLTTPLIIMLGDKSPADYIWVPDSIFINAQKSRQHKVTVNNDKLDIYPNGTVFWGSRVTIFASCQLDLRKYPLDTQTCHVGIESYAYPVNHILYEWNIGPNGKGCQIKSSYMAQFTVTNYQTYKTVEEYTLGNYSVLYATFTFKRRIAVSIIQIFFPTISVVSVSWVSLFMQKKSSSARIGLGVTTLLTLCTIWGSINTRLPLVSYVKAVDLYFMISFCFVLCTLLEYTLVLNLDYYKLLMTQGKRKKLEKQIHVKSNTDVYQMQVMKHRSIIRTPSSVSQYDQAEETDTLAAKIIASDKRQRLSNKRRHTLGDINVFRSFVPHRTFKQALTKNPTAIELENLTYTTMKSRRKSLGEPLHDPRRKSVVQYYDRDELLELVESDQGGIRSVTYASQEAERKEQVKIEVGDADRTSTIDLYSRLGFPFCYLMFNLWFWMHYYDSAPQEAGAI